MGHHHQHAEVNGFRLYLTIGLNVIITVTEIIGGMISGSLALLSDAIHNLSDTISLVLSGVAIHYAKKDASNSNTFGYKRAEILAALFNSGSMLVICVLLVKEAIVRFFHPEPIQGEIMLIVATIGLVANLFSMLLLKNDSKKSLNIKSAYLHMLADTLSSVAVVGGGIVLIFYNLPWLDSLLTLVIALYILKESVGAFKMAFKIVMESTPPKLDVIAIKNRVESIENVKNLHHLHVWNLTEKEIILEGHITTEKDVMISESERLLATIKEELHHSFGIDHVTLQFESTVCDSDTLIDNNH